MTGGGASDHPPPHPSTNDGEFLLRLVQNHRQPPPPHHPNHPINHHHLSLDPAVAAVGPSVPIPLPSTSTTTTTHNHRDPFSLSPQNPTFFYQQHPQQIYPQNTPPPPNHQTPSFFSAPHQHFDLRHHHRHHDNVLFGNVPFPKTSNNNNNNNSNNNNNNNNNASLSLDHDSLNLKLQLGFDLFKERELGYALGTRTGNGFGPNRVIDARVNWVSGSPEGRRSGPPPGFSGKVVNKRRSFSESDNGCSRESSGSSSSGSFSSEFNGNFRGGFGSRMKDHERGDGRGLSRDNGTGLSGQLDHPGLPSGSDLRSVSASDVEESLMNSRGGGGTVGNGVSWDEVDELSERLVDSVLGEDEADGKNETSSTKKKHHRDKDFRSDARGKWILSQRMRNSRRLIECRRDIDRWNASFLAIYESLIPVGEEKAKQKQLLTLLEKLVCKEWPHAKLYVYGSCANSFGVSKSDIDICLAIDDQDINKAEVLLKLADILQSDNLQNVQALTRARVPIVKLMDPVTGISCDICINNVLAVVNTKLLRNYAEIDARLRQLAFLVKHWAKSRGVNETYQGTLSSYAYVLMCIHFLQQRSPPILPCLQGMKATYTVTVDDIGCAFFDQVEKIRDFGARNKESISQLLWSFFNYWAYCHDYANSVISIRTGCILSKHEKDWTRRVGNDRHLICIEDPFEITHDLGRVVDKHSIRVLREEFERAAEIIQYDPNPCIALFEPYIPS